ncbi:sigma 54-interacting transcriptional regulator, partial [Nitrospira defluvii]|nr:sigma 54-interacting transcriptional regulator [Nitrospira defluvii]
ASSLISLLEGTWGEVVLRTQEGEEGWEFYGSIEKAPRDGKKVKDLRALLSTADSLSKQGATTLLGPDIPEALRHRNLKALHIFPLRTLKDRLGFLLLGTLEALALSPQHDALLNTLANHLAMVLENSRLRRFQQGQKIRLEHCVKERTIEIKRKEEQQRALVEINRAVSAHLDRDRLFQAIADAVRFVVSFDRMAIILPRASENALLLHAFEFKKGKSYRHPGAILPRLETVPGWVLEHKQPFVGSSLEDLSPFPISLSVLMKKGMQSHCLIPLLAKDRALGVLAFHSKKPGRYNPEDLPFLEEVAAAVAVALDNCQAYEEIKQLKNRLNQENLYLQEEIKTEYNFEEIIGKSRNLKKVLKSVALVARTDSSVFITGETGTGKELIARAVHNLSKRKTRALIKVNCAALPSSLIESELFGHEKGAFTGAISRKIGRFELADGGTLFLDEIGDLPLDLQGKLLRVLQEGEFERVGGEKTTQVDVRVIAATNKDLEKAMRENRFREDLYYRINVFPVYLPPLRERQEDILLLTQYFLEKYATRMDKHIDKIGQEAMRQLQAYPWLGNIRELENIVERAVILCQGHILEEEDFLLPLVNRPREGAERPMALNEVEREHISWVLEKTRWVIDGPKGAAKILNLHPNTLRSRVRKLGIK